MKLKMMTLEGSTVIDTNAVTQFSPDHFHGGDYTKVETVNADGTFTEALVKHDFYQITQALANAWAMEEQAKNRVGKCT